MSASVVDTPAVPVAPVAPNVVRGGRGRRVVLVEVVLAALTVTVFVVDDPQPATATTPRASTVAQRVNESVPHMAGPSLGSMSGRRSYRASRAQHLALAGDAPRG